VIEFDDEEIDVNALPGGAAGTAAIYTQSVQATPVIRTVMMQFFTAHGAGVIDRQIPAEQRTAATLGTFAFPPL